MPPPPAVPTPYRTPHALSLPPCIGGGADNGAHCPPGAPRSLSYSRDMVLLASTAARVQHSAALALLAVPQPFAPAPRAEAGRGRCLAPGAARRVSTTRALARALATAPRAAAAVEQQTMAAQVRPLLSSAAVPAPACRGLCRSVDRACVDDARLRLPCFAAPLAHPPRPPAQPFVIVGGGRVGAALAEMASPSAAGTADVVVGRGQAVPDDAAPGTPIVVCTRNDALAGVVEATPPSRRKGGWVGGWAWKGFLLARRPLPTHPAPALSRPCVHPERHVAALAGRAGPGRQHTGG